MPSNPAGAGGQNSQSSSQISGSVERDPGLQAAALDVFEAAATLTGPEDTSAEARLRRMLRDGMGRLRERVEAARQKISE